MLALDMTLEKSLFYKLSNLGCDWIRSLFCLPSFDPLSHLSDRN